jgi:hypothetical protein
MPTKHLLPLFLLAVALSLALPASAQIYQWKDKNGKTIISDKPPPDRVPPPKPAEVDGGADAESTPAPVAKPAPRPPAWVDQEMEFRKRQMEAQEKAEKEAKEAASAATREENCQKMSRWLQMLESGQRLSSLDDKGERQFMNDAQRAQEMEKTKSAYEAQCQ